MRLVNKVALVTRASSRVGEAISLRLAEEGAAVVVADLDLIDARRVAAMIWAQGGQALPLEQNAMEQASWDSAVESCSREFGSLNVLVNNVITAPQCSIENTSFGSWQANQEKEVGALYLGTQVGIKAMKHSGGAIINVSSGEQLNDYGAAAYRPWRGGIHSFTQSTAAHCSQNRYPIRVNAVFSWVLQNGHYDGTSESLTEQRLAVVETGALSDVFVPKPEQCRDFANSVLFFASEEAQHISGAELDVGWGSSPESGFAGSDTSACLQSYS